jgi:hypothetical protein
VGAAASGWLYTVEPGVPLLAMGVFYLLVTVALTAGSAMSRSLSPACNGREEAGN